MEKIQGKKFQLELLVSVTFSSKFSISMRNEQIFHEKMKNEIFLQQFLLCLVGFQEKENHL